MHSAWSWPRLPFGLVLDEGNMLAVEEDGSTTTAVTGLVPGMPMSYALVNDLVYWSNGVQCGTLDMGLVARPWNTAHPNGQPALAAGSGALPEGTYQVAVSFVNQFGRESGALRAESVDVPANGSIVLSGIPQPPAGHSIRVYMTTANGSMLRLATVVDVGTASLELTAPAEGQPCDVLLLRPLPPGHLLAHGNGRLFVARGSQVLFSPALRYGLHNPAAAQVSFNGRVSMIAFVGDGTEGAGLFVADEKRTYFLAGDDPANWRQVIAHAHGALPGQITWAPGDVWGLQTTQLLPVWQSRNGRLCVGSPGGKIIQPQFGDGMPAAVFDAADSAALGFIERDGDRRVVSSLKGAGPQALAMKDRLVVREYRHDT